MDVVAGGVPVLLMLWRILVCARVLLSSEPRRLVRIDGSAREDEFIPPERIDFFK